MLEKIISSLTKFALGKPSGVIKMIMHSIPAKNVIMVVPGIDGITRKEITGKTSINRLTYCLTNLSFEFFSASAGCCAIYIFIRY
jgi:hypothetical protein